jgi:glycosyltransferase involved in cell wall biosynthesis
VSATIARPISTVRRPNQHHRVERASTLSVIVTTYNEGEELRRTVESVLGATRSPVEVVVVDDGSIDDSCASIEGPAVRVIRHDTRLGVAPSRNAGASASSGTVLAFIDGHQRFSPGCLDQCAEVARSRNAIVWPDIAGLDTQSSVVHGAILRLCPETGGFSAIYRGSRPPSRISRITALRVPAYVMPRRVYQNVRWSTALRGWGGSEASVSVKAFFLAVPILHLCGPLARHLFRKKFPYEVTREGVDWNHAAIARLCFADRTWYEYWLPNVFASQLPESKLAELESPAIREEQREFQRRKVHSDRDFWPLLLKVPEPACLRRTSVAPARGKFQIAAE